MFPKEQIVMKFTCSTLSKYLMIPFTFYSVFGIYFLKSVRQKKPGILWKNKRLISIRNFRKWKDADNKSLIFTKQFKALPAPLSQNMQNHKGEFFTVKSIPPLKNDIIQRFTMSSCIAHANLTCSNLVRCVKMFL